MPTDAPNHRIPEYQPRRPSKAGVASFVLICLITAFGVAAYGAVDPLATSIIAAIIFAIAVLWAYESYSSGEARVPANSLLYFVSGLAAVGMIQLLPLRVSGTDGSIGLDVSMALSLDPFATRMFVVSLILLALFFAASLVFVDGPKRLRDLLIFLIAFGTLMAFFGILQKLAAPDAIYGLRLTPQSIPFGSYVNQHHFASLMMMLSAPAVGIVIASDIRRDLLPLLLIGAGMMAIAMLFTGSRGGVLSYIAMLSVVVIYARRAPTGPRLADDGGPGPTGKLLTAAGYVMLGCVVFGIVVLLGAGENMLRGFGLGGAVDDVSSGRFYFWSIAFKIFADHPILGAGLDAFGVAFTRYDTKNGLYRVEQAHNEYLQILADSGIAGFLLIAGFAAVLISQARRSIMSAPGKLEFGVRLGAFAGCMGVLVHSFFDFPLRTNANAYVFLLLVVIAVQPIAFNANKASGRKRDAA